MRNQSIFIKKSATYLTALFAVFTIAACGSGSGGGGGGATGNEAGTVTDGSGNTLTSVDTNDPVNLNLTGFTANSQFSAVVTNPSGQLLSPDGGFIFWSDEDGNNSGTFVQNLGTTQNFVAAQALSLEGEIVGSPKAQTGTYTINIDNMSGEDILDLTFTVEDGSKVFCSDAAGTEGASFLPTDTVYATVQKASGSLADGTYNVHVRSDRLAAAATGDPLGAVVTTVTVASGTGTANLGTYATAGTINDVIIDVNGNGTFDYGTDLISRHLRLSACFTIQNAVGTSSTLSASVLGGATQAQLCSDSNGNYRDIFDPNAADASIRDMFAWIAPLTRRSINHRTGICKYVVLHQSTWNVGDTLTDVTGGDGTARDPVQAFCTNERPWLIWPRQLLSPGCYDVVIDLNCDGLLSADDIVDNYDSAFMETCGCMVADTGCEDNVTIVTPDAGSSTDQSTATLSGTIAGDLSSVSVRVVITSGLSSNTTNLPIDTSTGAFSQTIPLFGGVNRITVFADYSGQTRICSKTILVTSTAQGGGSGSGALRAQLVWNEDDTVDDDMDLHLVEPGGTYIGGAGNSTDCGFNNCTEAATGGAGLEWGTAGVTTDNPHLDVDCISNCSGIENIVMEQVTDNGRYTIIVDAYNNAAASGVVVHVFIGGASVGTVNCPALTGGAANDSCLVGYVDWAAGTGTFVPAGTTFAPPLTP